MRVRLDSLGRPRPPHSTASSTDPAKNSTPPRTPSPSPPPQSQSQPTSTSPNRESKAPKPPLSSKPPIPHATPSRSTTPPPNPSPPSPAQPSPSVVKQSPPSQPEDERASDSGSSFTEAYNSEDEHTIPNPSPPTLADRERLFVQQLSTRGLRIVEMRPDGNCLFRALAHILWHDAEDHMGLRLRVMDYVVQERDYFSQFVAEDFKRYCRRKMREGVHGNHLELQAAAELFGRVIEVYSYDKTPSTVIRPWGDRDGERAGIEAVPIRLSFHRGSHYNAVVEIEGKEAKRVGLGPIQSTIGDEEEEELERAVLALSLVEAVGRVSGGSSSMGPVPNNVQALIHVGYGEDIAWEAYRMAGDGGLRSMIRFAKQGRDLGGRQRGTGSSREDHGAAANAR